MQDKTIGILKKIYDIFFEVPIEELLDKIESEEEERNFENLNYKVSNVVSQWLFNIHKDSSKLKESDFYKIITSIKNFIPEKIQKVNGGEYFKNTVVTLQLDFRKEELSIETYLIGYMINSEKKILKLEAKLSDRRDDVPNVIRNRLLSENSISMDLYNNKKSFVGGKN